MFTYSLRAPFLESKECNKPELLLLFVHIKKKYLLIYFLSYPKRHGMVCGILHLKCKNKYFSIKKIYKSNSKKINDISPTTY